VNTEGVGVAVAFLAGLASFASPCVLPLVPAYLGMLTGLSLDGLAEHRSQVLTDALLFVLGFSLVFVGWGAAATAIGRLISQHMVWVQRVGGICLVLFGLHLVGALRLPILYREHSLRSVRSRTGYLASFLTGVFFFAGWVPCVGPVLAAILMLAGKSETIWNGIGLLGAYSLGLGLPFLLMAFFAGYVLPVVPRLGRATRWIEATSGVIVMAIGIAIFFDTLVVFSRYPTWF